MSELKREWIGGVSFQVGNWPAVRFTGRRPVAVADEGLRNMLVSTGVVEDLGDGTVRYVGKVTIAKIDGSKYTVGKDGFVTIDPEQTKAGKTLVEKELEAPKE